MMMMNPNQMSHITREELRDTYGLSEDEILELDRESQRIMGKTIMRVDTALRDLEIEPEERIQAGLNFIEMAMTLIEYNFDSIVDSKVPKGSKLN